jgi:membrane-associated phospholipid phosphatase
MNPFIALDYIGHYGPPILFLITFYSLFERHIYMFVFLFGSLINCWINMFLKHIFREPRPINPLQFIDSNDLIGNNYYGLPSGHAQSVFFSLTFLYQIMKPGSNYSYIMTFYIMSCITILTLYQRWKYRRHTIKQLIIGAIVGTFFAWTLVFTTKTYLHSYKQKFLYI